MKIVHAADIHLDSPLCGLASYPDAPVERIREATRRAFENLVELCIEQQAGLLLLAGDLYDGSWKDYSTGLFFAAQMTKLREAGVSVAWIRGNHDAASQIARRLKLPDNVRELSFKRAETVRYESLGVAVHGQGFATREVRENIALAYPEPLPGLVNLGLLHTSVSGRPGHEPYAPCKLEDLVRRGYDYWALGHVHAREVLSSEPWVVFPGNLQGRHVRETGPKGATLIEVDAGRVQSASEVVLDVVRFAQHAVDASTCDDEDDVRSAVRAAVQAEVERAEGRLVALRVAIVGGTRAHAELAGDPERWTAEVRAIATDAAYGDVWVEKVSLQTAPLVDPLELGQRDDPIGQLVRSLSELKRDDAALVELASELSDIESKLRDLGADPDGFSFADPTSLRAALDDVERLILPRLLGKEAGQ